MNEDDGDGRAGMAPCDDGGGGRGKEGGLVLWLTTESTIFEV